jgi:hypothetical protein
MNDSTRTPKGQFKNGTSGNPFGRPAGSRNKATLACEQLLDGKSELLTAKLLDMALEGNIHAMRMCLDRTLPPRRERCINLELRPITSLQDLPILYQDITTAIADGRITPGEGLCLSNILSSHAQTMDRVNLDRRVAELEGQIPEMTLYRNEARAAAAERIAEAARIRKAAQKDNPRYIPKDVGPPK